MESKKIFEDAYCECFGVELLKNQLSLSREYSENKFDKEMAEAYKNPNLALKNYTQKKTL